MNLLDFKQIQKTFELKDPKGAVVIHFYSKNNKEFILHSGIPEFKEFLMLRCPVGCVGECYVKDSAILCCIGEANANLLIRRTNVRRAMKSVFLHLKRFNEHEICFGHSDFGGACDLVEDAIFSLILSSYSYSFLKKKNLQETVYEFLLNAPGYEKIIKMAHAQNIARFLGDTPANLMTPTLFTEYAKEILKDQYVDVKVLSKDFMAENNMNLVLSVAQGSVQEPRLLQVSYMGGGSNGIDVAVVGKGVCFDSGGISIKPAAEMYTQKADMMGAATLLCAIKAAADLRLKINIVGVFPLVENMPSGSATKPGDVFVSRSGITVEVDNTDAEGRLVLADGLSYAQQYNPRYLFDAATLTGAIRVALGNVYSGYFTENQEISDMIVESGDKFNDLMWRMPLSPFYREAMASHVADINNMGGPGAGSSKAAEFLKEFVDTEKTVWVHFDIAGTKRGSYIPEMHGKEVTGRPLPVFVDLFEKISENENN